MAVRVVATSALSRIFSGPTADGVVATPAYTTTTPTLPAVVGSGVTLSTAAANYEVVATMGNTDNAIACHIDANGDVLCYRSVNVYFTF